MVTAFFDRRLSALGLMGLAVASALPSVICLCIFGIISKHDSGGYVFYAEQIRNHTLLSGEALLTSSPEPITLFRIGGFPALLAMLQTIFPQKWEIFLVILQISTQSGVVVLAYLTATRLNASPRLALIAALLPAIGFVIIINICVLTDALYSAAITAAAFILIIKQNWRGALLAGLLIGIAMSFREATMFLVLAFIPLACLPPRKLLCIALVVAPCWGVTAAQIAWNKSRGVGAIVTTTAQITMVQATLPLLKHKIPVYDESTVFDRIATATVGIDGYDRIDEMQSELFNAGYTAPQIASEASNSYDSAWLRFPWQMFVNTLSNYKVCFLAMPFEPLDVAAFLMEYNDEPRPRFTRLNILWRGLTHGDFSALFWLLAFGLCRAIGIIIGACGLVAPWLRQMSGDVKWQLRALWCLPVAFTGLYMLVHLEYRYLVPVEPIICVLAASGFSDRRKVIFKTLNKTAMTPTVIGGRIKSES